MTPVSDTQVDGLVALASQFSTRGGVGLKAWARAFMRGHQRVPGGLSVEVGSHIGGSAMLFGALLEAMYGEANAPALWCVDPFGGKPYVGGVGDTAEARPPIFNDDTFRAFKQNTRGAGYLAHWMMTSRDFFDRLDGLPYWRPGDATVTAFDTNSGQPLQMRVGVRHKAGKNSCAFILLDGEHSADSIMADFKGAFRWLHPDGVMVIDNIDTDPYTLGRLREEIEPPEATWPWKLELGPSVEKPEWAVIST